MVYLFVRWAVVVYLLGLCNLCGFMVYSLFPMCDLVRMIRLLVCLLSYVFASLVYLCFYGGYLVCLFYLLETIDTYLRTNTIEFVVKPHLPQPNITPTHYNCPWYPFLGRSGFILPLPGSFGFPLNPAGPGPSHSRLPNRNATHAGPVPAMSDPATRCPADEVRHRGKQRKMYARWNHDAGGEHYIRICGLAWLTTQPPCPRTIRSGITSRSTQRRNFVCFLYEIKPAQFVKKIIHAAATWPRKAHICMTNPTCDAGWHFLKVDRARV